RQRAARVRIGRTFESPVQVRQLDEVKLGGGIAGAGAAARGRATAGDEPRGEDDATVTGQPEEIAPIDLLFHEDSFRNQQRQPRIRRPSRLYYRARSRKSP